jgi:hypothetical protein
MSSFQTIPLDYEAMIFFFQVLFFQIFSLAKWIGVLNTFSHFTLCALGIEASYLYGVY